MCYIIQAVCSSCLFVKIKLKYVALKFKQNNCVLMSLSWFRHYKLSVVAMCFVFPTLVPWYFWGESLWVAYFIPGLLRYAVVLNASWLVNSAAHMWGMKPYDRNINPSENKFVAFAAIGRRISKFFFMFCF